jgi:phosphoribosylglycinamide formyltransferase-1
MPPPSTRTAAATTRRVGALARARTAGIVTAHLSGVIHADPEELDRAIAATLLRHGTDLVVLAGYMRKLGPCTLAAFDGRILNVHPAFLPKFGGVGTISLCRSASVLPGGISATSPLTPQRFHGRALAPQGTERRTVRYRWG